MEREFRNVLAEFLKDNGISQTAFAKATGVKQSQVAEWLIGKNCPNYFTLKNICLAYDISADYFFGNHRGLPQKTSERTPLRSI